MKNVRDEYARWLATIEWTYFTTLTTGYTLSTKSARRLAHRFFEIINRSAPITMFWAAENFECKDGQHLHALIQVPNKFPRKRLEHAFQLACGKSEAMGWQRIDLRPFKKSKSGTFYIMKDFLKPGTDYDLFVPKHGPKL